ncbi:MAG TPA: penicillin-binding protein [Jatrophihabitantaceae bacterium]|nr:penicillin-binding protein [Jatrophihabitantaceae bacterium]
MAGTPEGQVPWPVIGKLVAALVGAGVLIAGFLLPYVGGLGLAAEHEANKFLNTTCNLTESAPPQKTTLLANDGKTVIATIFSQDRVPIPLSQVPTYLQQALVATEDRRFYKHHGVDMRGLIRSAVSTSNGDTQGGSTLTMQYVKQIRLYQAGKDLAKQRAAVAQNLQRKMEDAQCAIAIEKRESKNQILDNYLNIAFFGENSFGLQTAAETYFGKPAKDLTLPEAALLVGVLRAPSAYDPFVYPEAARARRNQVLQNLVDVGNLTQAQASRYEAQPISLATTKPPQVKEGCAHAQTTIRNVGFFCDYVVHWLETTGHISDLDTGGYQIVTTLDVKDQNQIQKNLWQAIPAGSPMTAIMPVIDPKTGDILAMATSKRYGNPTSRKDHSHTTLPIFTSYTAFGASTYKLFPLLTALSTGVPSDWPLQNTSPYKAGTCYTPTDTTNGDAQETYNANETLTSATVKSSNTFFVGLADQLLSCQLQPIVNIAEQLGMKGLEEPSDTPKQTVAQTIVENQRAQQLVLGDISTSPLEIAGAYAAVANDGEFNAPSPVVAIKKPVLKAGQEVASDPSTDAYTAIETHRAHPVQVVSPQVARQAVQILSGDTKYPGTSAQPFQSWYSTNSSIVAGKTGTAVAADESKNSSIWFIGLTPQLVAADAIVNLDSPFAPSRGLPGASTGAAYGDYASQVWLDALQPLLQDKQWTWPTPDSVPGTEVPDLTGHSLSEAANMLSDAGFKMQQLDKADNVSCASDVTYGQVAYYAPQIATKGATITVCPSSGQPQLVSHYTPPPVNNQGHGNHPGGGTGNGGTGTGTSGSGGGGAGGGGGASGGPGGGGASGGPGGGPGHGGSHHGPGGPGH